MSTRTSVTFTRPDWSARCDAGYLHLWSTPQAPSPPVSGGGATRHLRRGRSLAGDERKEAEVTPNRATTFPAVRLSYGEAEERFRAELVEWLEAHAPAPEVLAQEKLSSAHLSDWAREWQRDLFDSGWLIPGWPPELGGRNATASEQMIYFEEMKRREIPRSLNPQGIGIIAPSLRDAGTPEQQERWLLPTLRAEIAWCLGMSEPGAGSDLASEPNALQML